MSKVWKIFLRNKCSEIAGKIKVLLLSIIVAIVIGAILTVIWFCIGYGVYKLLPMFYAWLGHPADFENLMGTGIGLSILILGPSFLSYYLFYDWPKQFKEWIADNWIKAKREALK